MTAEDPTLDEADADVRCEVRIEAKPEVVFGYLTDPSRIVAWMGSEATLDPRPGGVYRVRVRPDNVARGEFVVVEPPHRVVFTWGWEGEDPLVAPGASSVEVELEPEDGATVVRLTHRDLPTAEARRLHGIGWEHYLSRLDIAASGGDPGPDQGPAPPAG